MTLYMKQKVFSWSDRFTIKDELGNDRYYVEGELFSWGHKLHVFDIDNQEASPRLPKRTLHGGTVTVLTLPEERMKLWS